MRGLFKKPSSGRMRRDPKELEHREHAGQDNSLIPSKRNKEKDKKTT